MNELGGGFSSFGEIEIFGNAVADFEYEEEYAAQFKEGKLIYSQGEELDVTDLSITVTDNAGGILVQTVNVTAEMVTGFTSAKAAESVTLTITYKGKTATYNVEIKPLSVQDGEETEEGCGCGSVAAGYASFAFAGVVLAIAFALAMKRKRA